MKGHQVLIFIFAVAAIDSCLSNTYTKQQDEQQRCANKMMDCVEDFRRLYFGRKYTEARKEIQPARQCLDSLTCSLPEYLNYLKVYELDAAEAEYKSGILTGKCNYKAAEKCDLIAHGVNVDDYPEKREANTNNNDNPFYDYEKCSVIIQSGRDCLLAFKPYCVSPNQVKLYQNTMTTIDAIACPVRRLMFS